MKTKVKEMKNRMKKMMDSDKQSCVTMKRRAKQKNVKKLKCLKELKTIIVL